jgi:hypothetical protein
LPTIVQAAAARTPIGLVLADAEFDSERNHTYVRGQLGAQSVIPAKRGKKTWRIHGVASRDAPSIPAKDVSAARFDRERVLFGETQALGPRTGPFAAHAEAPSLAARLEFQSVSTVASLSFREDVNRANLSHKSLTACRLSGQNFRIADTPGNCLAPSGWV